MRKKVQQSDTAHYVSSRHTKPCLTFWSFVSHYNYGIFKQWKYETNWVIFQNDNALVDSNVTSALWMSSNVWRRLSNHTVLLYCLAFERFDSSCPQRFTFLSLQLISECFKYFKICSCIYAILISIGSELQILSTAFNIYSSSLKKQQQLKCHLHLNVFSLHFHFALKMAS